MTDADPVLFPDFENTVRPMMQAAEHDPDLAVDAIFLGNSWSRLAAVSGLAESPKYAEDIAWVMTAEVAIEKNDFDVAYKPCLA